MPLNEEHKPDYIYIYIYSLVYVLHLMAFSGVFNAKDIYVEF